MRGVKAELQTPRAPTLDKLAGVAFVFRLRKHPSPPILQEWPAQIFYSADGAEVSCNHCTFGSPRQAEVLVVAWDVVSFLVVIKIYDN
jgi:hypothetical protein